MDLIPEDDKTISILNRVVRWEKDHLRYEADPRHVEKLARDLGMENCKPYTTPGVKPTSPSTILDDGVSGSGVPTGAQGASDKLDREGMKLYRSAVARCNYLSSGSVRDRIHHEGALQVDVQSIGGRPGGSQEALSVSPRSAPLGAKDRVRRICPERRQGLRGLGLGWMPPDSQVHEWRRPDARRDGGPRLVDEPGGDRPVQWRGRILRRAERSESGTGVPINAEDIGLRTTVTLFSDSSAARGIIHRTGLGKLRHLEVGYLWLQAAVARKRLQVRKVNGLENPGTSLRSS